MGKHPVQPWTPLSYEVSGKKISIHVWGRTYVFDESIFPTSVTTAGREILSGPIQLHTFFHGKEDNLRESSVIFGEHDEEHFVFTVSQTAGNIIINARINVEYDGFARVQFTVIPFWSFSANNQKVPSLDRLYIEIPVKKEFASLYHYWPNDDTSIIPAQDVVNSGRLAEEGLNLPFKPYIWAGWEDGGLGCMTQSDENIQVAVREKTVEYIPDGDQVRIRFHLLDQMPRQWQGEKDEWVHTLPPLEYDFSFQATPVKPLPEDYLESWRVYHCSFADGRHLNEDSGRLPQLASKGVKWIIFHEDWSLIQNYGMAWSEEKFKKLVHDCHKAGIKVMTYFGYEYSTLAPDWHENAENNLVKTTDGQYTGGWQRKPHQRAFMVCYHGRYNDKMLERIAYVMDEYKVDGIYIDSGFVPWECANEKHGCGYRDEKGQLHTTFPMMAVREHFKKMYEIVHARGGVIDAHNSACCVTPTLGFADTLLDAENVQSNYREGLDKFIDLDAFRAEYMGYPMGMPDHFLVSTGDGKFSLSRLAAIPLLHNVYPRPINTIGHMEDELDYMSGLWKLYDEIDAVHAQWHPYWEKDSAVASLTENVYVSWFENKDRILLLAVRLGEDTGIPAKIRLPEGYTPQSDYQVEQQELSVTVAPYTPVYIKLEKQR